MAGDPCRKKFLLVLLAALAAPLGASEAADWPQYMGPGASGVSPETDLARSWPEGGPPVLWTRDLGEGFGSAAVRDGKVYVLDRVQNRQDVLRCLDLATGHEEWTYAYDAPGQLPHNGSRQAPAVDEKYVFAVGPFGHLNCIDRTTHRPAWSHPILQEFPDSPAEAARRPSEWWGIAQCPVLYRDTVIVAPRSDKVGLAAYERETGKVRWTSPPVGRAAFAYVTPTLMTLGGTDQVVLLTNTDPGQWKPAIIASVDAATGRLLWKLETWKPYKLPISAPLRIADDRLFVSGAYGIGCFALRVKKDGDAWAAEYAFKDNGHCAAHLHAPVLYKGHIFAQSFDIHGKPAAQNGLVCLDLDGNLKWKSGPQVLFDAGGFLIADGLIFIVHGKKGELNLVEAVPDGFKPLAQAKVLAGEGGPLWAPLALSQGKLLVRDQRQMKCLDVRKP
jgi:outer membrane protein assembly factor BamB